MAEAELIRVLATPENVAVAGSVAKKGISGITILIAAGLFFLFIIIVAILASKGKKAKQKSAKGAAGKAASSKASGK